MRKRYIWFIVAAALLIAVSTGVTVALLVASSNTVVNTFTVGGVNITLTETTGDKYIMAPGVTLEKDPVVTVLANSERSWLYVKVEKKNDFDAFCTYEIGDGWTALEGEDGVYYRSIAKTSSDQVYPVLKNNSISVSDTVTEEQLNAVTQNPTLEFTAYAVQNDGIGTAAEGWQIINNERGSN